MNTMKYSKLMVLCNRCNIMHQIAYTFFKIFSGMTPRTPFLMLGSEWGPSPQKSWLRACSLSLAYEW